MTSRLDIFLPSEFIARGPSYTCGMIAKGLVSREIDDRPLNVNIVTPRASSFTIPSVGVTEALPIWARRLPYRVSRPLALATIDTAFLRIVREVTADNRGAYIWPNASVSTINELKSRGITVFREMINGPRWRAKQLLDDAYKRLAARPTHGLDDTSAEVERDALHAADYVFSPNGMVTKSLQETGLPPTKILEASYGWDPQRFAGATRLLPPIDGVRIAFVGTIGVRKGAHLILDYWARSKVRGELVLAGAMEAAIKEQCGSLLARPDVTVLDYVSDAGALYRSADIFAFPTIEEGGPQVTYEACGCGLPVITSPMGAGRVVNDGREGYVLDPYDAAGWVAAIQELATDVSKRSLMAEAALASADDYRWEAVSARRKTQIVDRLEPHAESSDLSQALAGLISSHETTVAERPIGAA
ncbi:glycosyltransferase family 4 protein [Bradyrhizobium genosp. L]|uniref:glycosyltransferase family 4 protein n=1 Tax=Bradyrhizobium genosp. L TaxID=83637 RepID=UPI0018A2DF45|nr:glycosyltransferase family 4 protein [Bradyrhizobium genosp. L]QPF86548.1 glycosyltransferase family 4 protein [Bradyrhizobium genosp. L]